MVSDRLAFVADDETSCLLGTSRHASIDVYIETFQKIRPFQTKSSEDSQWRRLKY
jgi:hypothetical protein